MPGYTVAPVPDCQKLQLSIGWTAALSVPLNCLLFFFRIRAVFYSFPRVVQCFGILWVVTFGCTMTAPFGLIAAHIEPTKNCIDAAVKSYTSSGLIAAAVYDTIVFVSISYKLVASSFADDWPGRLKSFFRGQYMGHISRVLLQSGQLYYL